MKLIDADELKRRIEEPEYSIYDGGQRAEWIEECIEKAPEIMIQKEIIANKSGKWSDQMLFNDGFGGARIGYICSVCKKYVPFAGKFCGNCGARMENGRSYDE